MPHHRIICGHVIPALKALPDEYVDMLMTSVPYWGLRNYGEDTVTIWGGNEDCEHEWLQHYQPKKGGKNLPENPPNVRADIVTQLSSLRNGDINTQFCSKCGGWRGQLGLEPSPDLYISHLRMVFAEVKRVLKKTGTCWVNIGDSYAGSGKGIGSSPDPKWEKARNDDMKHKTDWNGIDLPATCMCLIPELFLMMMVFDLGFILRNKNVWKKDNPMPSSVKNRFNNVWEPVFFFTKNNKPVYWYNDKSGIMVDKKPTSQIEGVDWDWKEVVDVNSHAESANTGFFNKEPYMENNPHRVRLQGEKKLKKVSHWHSVDYFFDLDAVRKPYTEPLNRWGGNEVKIPEKTKWKSDDEKAKWCMSIGDRQSRPNSSGKNPGDVVELTKEEWLEYCDYLWGLSHEHPDFFNINTQPFAQCHFAVFPMKLVEKPLLAGCPAEVCKHCGMARVRMVKEGNLVPDAVGYKPRGHKGDNEFVNRWNSGETNYGPNMHYEKETIGWSDCLCGKNPDYCFFCGYKEEHGALKLKDGIYICDECLLEGRGLENKYNPGICIDPFGGSGTVGIVAEKLGRSSILIDIKKDYCEMAFKRLKPLVEQTKLSGEQSTIKKEGF